MLKKLVASTFIICLCVLIWPAHANEKSISLPPASLAQWYKPANKRQVWLHTMFNLRRELQAIERYAEARDQAHLQKWSDQFLQHYESIQKMVPEWSDELDLEQLGLLKQSVALGAFDEIKRPLGKLKQTCKSCHGEFRVIVAASYRAPDFSGIQVKSAQGDQSYPDTMERLSTLINQIKIASEDGFYTEAKDALVELRANLGSLGETCDSCHQGEPEAKERFLGQRTYCAMEELQAGLESEDQKLTGRSLGGVAVYSCARCHSVHRSLMDLKGFID